MPEDQTEPEANGPENRPLPLLEADTPEDAFASHNAPTNLPLAVTLLAAQLLIADYITAYEVTAERQEKMARVTDHLRSELRSTTHLDPRALVASMAGSKGDVVGFLVEIYYLDPFSPYTIRFREFRRKRAMRLLAELMGAAPDVVEDIEGVSRAAIASHRGRNWMKTGLIGIGAAAVLGAGGWLAAPILGTALGAAAGLSGAAATAHGLALIGGGALAAGGAGMAGGMWLVAGAGATLGVVGGAGGAGLYRLGAATARAELIKLQVTFKLGLLSSGADMVKAQEVLKRMATEIDLVTKALVEERLLNDENARRVTELEGTLDALEKAVGWMKETAQGGRSG